MAWKSWKPNKNSQKITQKMLEGYVVIEDFKRTLTKFYNTTEKFYLVNRKI